MNVVDTVIASAGTGKTTRVVELLSSALAGGLAAERILATTFTNKAADELVERSRRALVEAGRAQEAAALLGASLGTVNSVCGRIVEAFALDLGRAPSTEVIDEVLQPIVFQAAADRAIAAHAAAMLPLARCFGHEERDRNGDPMGDWRKDVEKIIKCARANGVRAQDFASCAERSIESLFAILPPVEGTAGARDRALLDAINQTLSDLATLPKLTADAQKALPTWRRAAAMLAREEPLDWPTWCRLSKSKFGAKGEPLAADTLALAARHASHPRLRDDLTAYIRGCFACAEDALTAYQRYKDERGLVDFVDQEVLALEVLRRPDLEERLRERIGSVFVDEVQDSSPIQVAIFAELARIGERSTWVGDPKQAIYGFRGTDATLTLAACAGAADATGGRQDRLTTSWRSRPGIIRFVNDAFTPAFVADGLSAHDCRFDEPGDDPIEVPPLGVWYLHGKNAEVRAAALASGVRAALADPREWPVRQGQTVRALQAGDIAILCRDNVEVARLATALTSAGVPVAVEQGSLYAAAEVALALAALRWTADSSDHVALAEMARLVDGDDAPDRWLDAALADDPAEALRALVPFAGTLEEIRGAQLGLTPAELLDAVIERAALASIACRWGAGRARFETLEALRGLAREFESECRRLRLPATVGGLVLWLQRQQPPRPRSLDADAVTICTYHKAKGLEWPMVVMTQLESDRSASPFGVFAEVDGYVDWRAALDGRWVRMWPWPYGRHTENVVLDATGATSAPGQRLASARASEDRRLLYVGATRARDHLVFARNSGKPAAWLACLETASGSSVMLPASGETAITVGDRKHPARVIDLIAGDPVETTIERPYLALARAPWQPLALTVQPSSLTGEPGVSPTVIKLGERLPIAGSPDMVVLGEAIHAAFAADDPAHPPERRLARVSEVLDRWGVVALSAASVMTAIERLSSHARSAWPGARLKREVPAHGSRGPQMMSGRIDLLVEHDNWFIVVDHKSYPGAYSTWAAKAAAHHAQLSAYAEVIASATGKTCAGLVVHLPVVGSLLLFPGPAHGAPIGPGSLAADALDIPRSGDVEPSTI